MFAADGVGGGLGGWGGGGALKDTDAIFALRITDEITAPGRRTFGKPYPTTVVRHALISKTQQPKSPQFKYNCSNEQQVENLHCIITPKITENGTPTQSLYSK